MQKYTHHNGCLSGHCIRELLSLLACLVLCITVNSPQALAGEAALKMLKAVEAVSGAVGTALTGRGQAGDDKVDFAKPLKTDDHLKNNGFQLARINATSFDTEQMRGSLIFEDSLGRTAFVYFVIQYLEKGLGKYIIQEVRLTPFTPIVPKAAVFILPSEEADLKKMKRQGMADLMAFAKEYAIRIEPGAADTVHKDYVVLVFAMNRLMPKDGWLVSGGETLGTTWGKDGWLVSAVTANFAVNGREETVFRIFHAQGEGNPAGGKLVPVGFFTNKDRQLLPAGTAPVMVPLNVARLKAQYAVKAFENMKPD